MAIYIRSEVTKLGVATFFGFFVGIGIGVFLKKNIAIKIAKVVLIVFASLFVLLTIPSRPDLRINGNRMLAVISCIGIAVVCGVLFLGLSIGKNQIQK